MATYLLKTDPKKLSYDHLERGGKAQWAAGKSPSNTKHIRSAQKGDEAFLFHAGNEKALVGLVQLASDPYSAPKRGEPNRLVLDIKAVKRAKKPLSLAEIKAEKRFTEFPLVRQPRLDIMPVPAQLDSFLRASAGL